MFTSRFRGGFVLKSPGRTRPTAERAGTVGPPGGSLIRLVLLGLLAVGLPRMSYAQALGTMQVTARVIPGAVAWSGLAEAQAAARSAAGTRSWMPVVRRGRLVQARAEIRASAGLGLVVVTINHLRN